MHKYEKLLKLKTKMFKRRTGVKKKTFAVMLAILQEAEQKQKALGGKPNKLPLADQLLMCLEYMREYRTYFHVGNDYGISESTCFRNCRWVEEVLIKSKKFRLHGKKELLKTDREFEVILTDATESPIERPKKNSAKTEGTSKNTSIQVRRNAIQQKLRS